MTTLGSKIYLLFILFCTHFVATAQTDDYKIYTGSNKFNILSPKERIYKTGLYWGYPIEQQNKMFDRILKVDEVIRQIPYLKTSKGYNITFFNTTCSNGCDRGKPIIAQSGIIFRYFYTNAKTSKIETTAEGPSLNLYYNDIAKVVSRIPVNDDQYFAEPTITEFIDGVPIYNNYFAVVTNSKQPIFTILTRERELQISIKLKTKLLADLKASFSQPSQYKQWLASKEANKQAVLAGLAILAKTNPEKARTEREKFLKGIEETEKMYKDSEASIIDQQNQGVQKHVTELETLKSTLASLTTEEKSQPFTDDQGQKFVQPNKNFFNMKLPKDEIQIIVMDLFKYDRNDKSIASESYDRKAFKKVQEQINFKTLLNSISK